MHEQCTLCQSDTNCFVYSQDVRQDYEQWRWGYVIALSFFMVEALTFGVLKVQGVLFPELLLQFDCSPDVLAWVPSIAACTMNLLGEYELI